MEINFYESGKDKKNQERRQEVRNSLHVIRGGKKAVSDFSLDASDLKKDHFLKCHLLDKTTSERWLDVE